MKKNKPEPLTKMETVVVIQTLRREVVSRDRLMVISEHSANDRYRNLEEGQRHTLSALAKLDPHGNEAWMKTLGRRTQERCIRIVGAG